MVWTWTEKNCRWARITRPDHPAKFETLSISGWCLLQVNNVEVTNWLFTCASQFFLLLSSHKISATLTIISLCLTTTQDLNHLDKTSLEILAFLCNYLKGSFLLTHLSPVIGNRLLICVHAFDPSMILTLSLGVDSPNLCACFWPILTQSLGMDSPNLCACFWPILTQSLGMDSPNLCACFSPILTQSLEFNSTTRRAKLQHNPSSKLLLSLLFGVALYTRLAIQLLDRQAPAQISIFLLAVT